MERTEVLDMMGTLKLYGMKAAYDETLAVAKRSHEPQRFGGDLLKAEISEKQARSIKYQLTIARLPLAKDVDDFAFKGTPINEALVRDLASGAFLTQQRNAVRVGGTGAARPIWQRHRAQCIRAGSRGRFFTTLDLVNPLEAEARAGRPGRIADHLTRLDSSSSANSVISPSPRPEASCSSISSAASMCAPRSSSPPISLSANGRASSAIQK